MIISSPVSDFLSLPSSSLNCSLDDLNEKKTLEFHENVPSKVWNYLSRHLTDDFIETILHESSHQQNQSSNGHHAIKKARRTNDATQKIRPSYAKGTATLNSTSKGKRATRRSRM